MARRFWAKVEKTDSCWFWTAAIGGRGYGSFGIGGRSPRGRTHPAHRVAWELANGSIPNGLWVLHRCDNKRCVRVDHLYLGTARENSRDAIERGQASGPRGSRNPRAVLTWDLVAELREVYEAGDIGIRELARKYNLKYPTVRQAVKYESWIRP